MPGRAAAGAVAAHEYAPITAAAVQRTKEAEFKSTIFLYRMTLAPDPAQIFS
jgi:hypothetical protein